MSNRSNYYKTSNDLAISANNPYPWLPNENDTDNPYLFDNVPWVIQPDTPKTVKYVEPKNVTFAQPIVEQQKFTKETYNSSLEMKYKTDKYVNSANPEVWGPAFWFSLHNGALRYPIQASPTWKERMKHFILGIPVMVPCEKCSDHATAHLEANYYRMDEIVSSRSKLFEFFWEFHNFVNERLNKPKMSLDDAYKMYRGEVLLTKLEY
mgnify:FL=1